MLHVCMEMTYHLDHVMRLCRVR